MAVADGALVMAGPLPTMIDSTCVAFGLLPLLAVTVTVEVPAAVGVPVISALPLPSEVKVSPAGSAPDSVMAGAGLPVVVTANAPLWLRVKYAAAPLVMVGGVEAVTERARARVAVLPEALVAETVTGYVPLVPLAGVPAMVAVPLVL